MSVIARLEALEKKMEVMTAAAHSDANHNGETDASLAERINRSTMMAIEQDVSLVRRIDTVEALTHMNSLMMTGTAAALEYVLVTLGVDENSIPLSDDQKEQMETLLELIDACMQRATEGLSGEIVAESNTAFAHLLNTIRPATTDDGQMSTFDFGDGEHDDLADSFRAMFGDDTNIFSVDVETDGEGNVHVTSEGGADLRDVLADIFGTPDETVEEPLVDGEETMENLIAQLGTLPGVTVTELPDGNIHVTSDGTTDISGVMGDLVSMGAATDTTKVSEDIDNIFSAMVDDEADDSTVDEDTAMFHSQRAAEEEKAAIANAPKNMAELLSSIGIDPATVSDKEAQVARVKLITDEDEEGIVRESVRLAMQQVEAGHIDANDLRVLTAIFSGEGAEDLDEDDLALLPAPGPVAAQFSANLGQEQFTVVLRDRKDIMEVLLCIHVGSMAAAGLIPTTLFGLMELVAQSQA